MNFGESNINTILILSRLGEILISSQQVDEGLECIQRVISVKENINGRYHPDTIKSIRLLGENLFATGKWEAALVQFSIVYQYNLEHLEQNNVASFLCLLNMGQCKLNLGHFPEALDSIQQAYDGYKSLEGEGGGSTLLALANLCSALIGCKKFNVAVDHLNKLLEHYIRILGTEHQDAVTTRGKLASCLMDLGRCVGRIM